MTNPNLDIFDLKRLQLHQSKQELERTGRNIQQKVTSQDLSTFVPVDRDRECQECCVKRETSPA